jgi:predicted sugar kinase
MFKNAQPFPLGDHFSLVINLSQLLRLRTVSRLINIAFPMCGGDASAAPQASTAALLTMLPATLE